jgi:hypothetical protein
MTGFVFKPKSKVNDPKPAAAPVNKPEPVGV